MGIQITYPLISIGPKSTLLNSDIVLVKKKHWKITKTTLLDYLSKYDSSEIKRGKLVSKEGLSNTYNLSSEEGSETYDLILFLMNTFREGDSSDPTKYTSIGAIEIPEIGSKNINTKEKVVITFNEFDSILDIENLPLEVLSIRFDIKDYSSEVLGMSGSLDLKSADSYFLGLSKPQIQPADFEGISYVPKGVLFKNKIYRKEDLSLDFSSIEEGSTVLTHQSISHEYHEYIRITLIDLQGFKSIILRDITLSPLGLISDSVTTPSNVVVKYEQLYVTLVNPDYIITTNLFTKKTYRITTSEYILGGYTLISQVPNNLKTEVNNTLIWGTDITTNNVSTIFCNPGSSNWCLQSKYTKFFKGLEFLRANYFTYSIENHNVRIFILRQYDSTSFKKRIAVDYLGNTIELESDNYILDPDGVLIVNINNKNICYKGDLSSGIVLESTYDLYSIFPSGSEIIFQNQNLGLNNIILFRDRFQELN